MRVLFAGGGTGGHVYPALAMIDALRRWRAGTEICVVGTSRGLESRLLAKREDVSFCPIRVVGFPRGSTVAAIRSLAWLLVGLVQSLWILITFRPHIVVGVGGHSSFPPVFLAALLGRLFPMRTMIHEQNVIGGLANRVLSRWVDTVLVSFEDSRRSFPHARRLVVTGNPIREELLHARRSESAYRRFGLDPSRRTILIFGGSKGAEEITEQIRAGAEQIAARADLQVLLITGDQEKTRRLRRELSASGASNVVVESYVVEMGLAFAVADLVVCRAGATSLAEITACGKASILVPWRGAADDHQRANARLFRDKGACAVAEEDTLCRDGLLRLMHELIGDDEARARLAKNALRRGRPSATSAILGELDLLVREVRG